MTSVLLEPGKDKDKYLNSKYLNSNKAQDVSCQIHNS